MSRIVILVAAGSLVLGCNTTKAELETGRYKVCEPADPNAQVFDHAICLCGTMDGRGNGLTTSSFTSFKPVATSSHQAHVGVNGASNIIGNILVDGTLDVGGGLQGNGNLSIQQDLFVGEDLLAHGNFSVAGDASVAGSVTGSGHLTVGGTLSAGGTIDFTGFLQSAGSVEGAPFAPRTPCECENTIDVAAQVAAHRGSPALPLQSGAGNAQFTLTQGSYYSADGAFLRGNIRIRIEGAVQLFIENDVDLAGNGAVELADGAELDLYIAGSLRSVGNLVLGSSQAASRSLHLYVGGADTVTIDFRGNKWIRGAIYAPRADIDFLGNFLLEGSLFARNMIGRGNMMIRYDSGLTGEGCDPGDDSTDDNGDGSTDDNGDGSTDDNGDGSTDGCGSGDDAC